MRLSTHDVTAIKEHFRISRARFLGLREGLSLASVLPGPPVLPPTPDVRGACSHHGPCHCSQRHTLQLPCAECRHLSPLSGVTAVPLSPHDCVHWQRGPRGRCAPPLPLTPPMDCPTTRADNVLAWGRGSLSPGFMLSLWDTSRLGLHCPLPGLPYCPAGPTAYWVSSAGSDLGVFAPHFSNLSWHQARPGRLVHEGLGPPHRRGQIQTTWSHCYHGPR